MSASLSPRAPSVPMVLAEIAGAVVGGVALAVVGYIVPSLLLASGNIGMGLLAIQVFATIMGFGLGAGLGVGIAGRLLGQSGSVWLAVIASFLTGGTVILVLRLFNINIGGLFGIAGIALPLSLVAAVVGYNLRRRP